MNTGCMLLCSSSQKSPTQSLFANVLRQAKLFLLRKCNQFENQFCLGDRHVARLSVGRRQGREFPLQLPRVRHHAGLLTHISSQWLSEISITIPVSHMQQLRLRGANDGIWNWSQFCLASGGHAIPWVGWFATQTVIVKPPGLISQRGRGGRRERIKGSNSSRSIFLAYLLCRFFHITSSTRPSFNPLLVSIPLHTL